MVPESGEPPWIAMVWSCIGCLVPERKRQYTGALPRAGALRSLLAVERALEAVADFVSQRIVQLRVFTRIGVHGVDGALIERAPIAAPYGLAVLGGHPALQISLTSARLAMCQRTTIAPRSGDGAEAHPASSRTVQSVIVGRTMNVPQWFTGIYGRMAGQT